MTRLRQWPGLRPAAAVIVLATLAALSGCASVDFDRAVATTNQDAAGFTNGRLALARTDAQRAAQAQTAAELLSRPLGQGDAVQLALVNSPALQAILAENWTGAAAAAQSGRIANPILALTRMRIGDELEIERALTFGLLDLLLLPRRQAIATQRIGQAQLQLTAEVVEQVTQVRQVWVNAVAAQQSLLYAEQALASAEASAELARRMQAAGNFSKLARARQQAFYADAATQLAAAQHLAAATREQLVRQTGLTDRQAETMKLPDRLPDLPTAPRDPAAVGQAATAGRLDIRLARAAFDAAATTRGVNLVQSFTDIELGVLRATKFDNAEGTRTAGRGVEVSVRLPVFDWGDVQRDAFDAQTLALANRLEATVRAAGSNLRETYSAYRTTYDIARHYRDEIVPLRKTIAEETVLRYNGMLIGVFELLADSRDQIGSVIAAIGAQQQFWLADAALQATIMGRPTLSSVAATGTANKGGGDGAH